MSKQPSIWTYSDQLTPSVKPQNQLSIGEGHTPLQEIEGIFFKREDMNPTGSIKDRGFAYQISRLTQEGYNQFVISSSGNAAISAARYCQLAKAQLTVFVSPKVDTQKLHALKKLDVIIKTDPRPISSAHRFAEQLGYYNLRPSNCPYGSVGYQTLAFELNYQVADLSHTAIFMPVSSGTYYLGLIQGLKKQDQDFPQTYLIQTTQAHPIASRFQDHISNEKQSLATGIVAKHVPNLSLILETLNQTKGSACAVSNHQITQAHQWLTTHNLKTSYDSAVALAGYFKLRQQLTLPAKIICLLTGTNR